MENPVSIVIPMFNAEKHIVRVLDALLSQESYAGKIEIIVVNDGSSDRSRELIKPYEATGAIKVIDQANQGAVAATNNGFKAARHDVICSIDSDVVLGRDWLRKIMTEFDNPLVGAVQGYYKTPADISFWARMMGYDVEKRYDDIPDKYVTQVCTGDTAYRRSALEKTGLFDPAFVYGYDNDMSYRLQKAGYKLIFRKDAVCDHYWKADFTGYIKQQYWSAFGRMQLVAKHKDRIIGDSVSGLRMILQAPLTLLAAALFGMGGMARCAGLSSAGLVMIWGAAAVLGGLFADRLLFAVSVMKKQKDPRAILLAAVHLVRNIVWSWALCMWFVRGSKARS